jgi:cyclic beta-1,2-glucan synthetase
MISLSTCYQLVYAVDSHQRDISYYDLLASEVRLGLFVAIAQGKLPQESWFVLGRRLTTAGKTPVLLSWSGSMFEYLMPELVMPTYQNTLLDEMCIGTVKKQIAYGEQQDIPWGISESCYNLVDAHLTYQYKAFGVPGLGFKSGLGLDNVVAPYATLLALMIDPQSACANLEKMSQMGFEGEYGFYEAIDFTPSRLSRGQTHAIIQTFMSHHQGMSLLSLAYVLLNKPMQKRFEADLQFQTALLLLQERVPKSTGFYSGTSVNENLSTSITTSEIRVIKISNTPVPEVQLLSNGRYFVMLSNAGGGYSRWNDTCLTRWLEDGTCDNWGTFCYINDRTNKSFWSTAHQPTLKQADHYEAIFSQGRVEFRRSDNEIETYTEIIVSPEDDVEVRRIHLSNHSNVKRVLEVTSYGEVVLASSQSDESHPAFSNLFVQTEIQLDQNAIICTRRPRSLEERPPWMFHLMKVCGLDEYKVSYETDRSKFIGRGRTLVRPRIIDQAQPLSNTQGSVLDPVIAIQYKIMLLPGQSVIVDMVTGAGDTREHNQILIDKYQDKQLRDRAFELSWTHSQVVLRQIGSTEADAQVYGKLASSILYLNPLLRAHPSMIQKNYRGQSSLWSYSISGDIPIVVVQITDHKNVWLVKQLIKAQAYWHMNGLAVDVFIINEDPGAYRQILQDHIQGIIAAGVGGSGQDKRGRIFIRPMDQVSPEDRILLETVARVIISDTRGTLEDQVNRRSVVKAVIPRLIVSKTLPFQIKKAESPIDLQFYNGIGGFSSDGKEYIITTDESLKTPLPWINVIANPQFGTIISESGSSYTWFQNAHEYRLTPWKNDAVQDASGEAFYLRDEESGKFWSAVGQSGVGQSSCVTHHGFGYSRFNRNEDGITSQVTVHVDKEYPVKFIAIKVSNQSGGTRKLSITGYVEWVLGELRSKSILHTITEMNIESGALMAWNNYNTEFQNYVSFFDVDHSGFTYTSDRTEFIGRNGSLQNPDALSRTHLSGKSGAGLDACAALQVQFILEPDKDYTVTFMLGAGKDISEAVNTIKHFQGGVAASESLKQVHQFWESTLGAVQIDTPDASVNILANGWLLYQVLSCRLWGRSGLYQSGGAFGFRDQLQDVLALIHVKPDLTRQQILLCATRQFSEGDVQHWWHPPSGRGVRTRCSDDFLWLPYVTSRYILLTEDAQLLDERIPYLQGRQLNQHEESYYDMPNLSGKSATLYEHCKLAIEHGLRFGEHGLPLMGSGDWNDGMNRVGIEDKGESVWLAFFLYDVLMQFKKIATLREDILFVDQCEQQAAQLKENIRLHAWDGEWYLRAFFDNGLPLGSKSNEECKIDAISQSWSILSGAGETQRSESAMNAVSEKLINRTKGIIQLLDPPFDKAPIDPGYIKGYAPGVRENGGQYTHAAIWMVMAFAKKGDQAMTEELLELINPIHHGKTMDQVAIYKAEPYVMAADVYGVNPHIGRGGWTWYTGSAGWMYQLILESFLGLKREGNILQFESCIPLAWESFRIQYRYHETVYNIEVHQGTENQTMVLVDGEIQSGQSFALINDMKEHFVIVNQSKELIKLR